MRLELKISEIHHSLLKNHLLPEDGMEAVAVALCGRYQSEEKIMLLVHDVMLIPVEDCERDFDFIRWPTERITPYFNKISKTDMAILKIHSHPGGYDRFSETDDLSDNEFFDSVFGWAVNENPHGSAVMLPDGSIFGRLFFYDLSHRPIDKVSVIGDHIRIWKKEPEFKEVEFAKRTIQAFGEKTYTMLSQLTIGVVGCSGTGSPLIEQLTRLGIGKLILIDPDLIEEKNINRILNSTLQDVREKKPKTNMLKTAIEKIGLGTEVSCYQTNLYDDISSLKALCRCDIIFGCMDSVDGRYLLNQLCSFYLLPYFDLGVKLEADNYGGISKICASVHYLQPGKSSLISRGVYTMDDVKAASQYRRNPEEYKNLLKNSYIKNVNINNPAVISVNMQIASHAVNEFLNRIHSYKAEHPSEYALSTIDMTENCIINVNEDSFNNDVYLKKKAGKGDVLPFLEMPELSV